MAYLFKIFCSHSWPHGGGVTQKANPCITSEYSGIRRPAIAQHLIHTSLPTIHDMIHAGRCPPCSCTHLLASFELYLLKGKIGRWNVRAGVTFGDFMVFMTKITSKVTCFWWLFEMVHHYSVKLGDDPEFLRFSCAQIIIKSAQDNLGLVGFLGCELTLNHIKSNWVMTRAGLRETCLDESPRAGCGRGVATTSLWY